MKSFRFAILLLFFPLTLCVGYTSCHTKDIQDLEEYSQRTKQLSPLMLRYSEQMQKAKSAKTYQELRQHLARKVAPFLKQYVAALQQIRPQTRTLQNIHLHLTKAYEHWQKSLQKYMQQLKSNANWVRNAQTLQEEALKIDQAEKKHQMHIKQYIHKLTTKAITP